MKDEAKVRRVVAALFKPLELSGERMELLEAVDSLLDIGREGLGDLEKRATKSERRKLKQR